MEHIRHAKEVHLCGQGWAEERAEVILVLKAILDFAGSPVVQKYLVVGAARGRAGVLVVPKEAAE